MTFSAQQISALINGTIEGNPEAQINNFAKIEEGFDGALSFLANLKYIKAIKNNKRNTILLLRIIYSQENTF